MAEKSFKSIDEQICLLRSRGLDIPDVDTAKEFLYRNNYYRISGYSLTLRSNDIFAKSATFQNIIDIYEFDRELRHILLKYIDIIEVTVKSIFAYEFAKVHGPFGYLNPQYFTNKEQHAVIIEKAEKQKNKRKSDEAYLKHFLDDLNSDIPLWAYVDLLTISDISFLCKISEPEIISEVAESIGINHSGVKLLEHFMHRITIIRNLCAHGNRLYNRLFQQKPRLSKAEQKLLRTDKNGCIDNSHLYGFIFIMRRLLKPTEFGAMTAEIIALTEKYPFVNMKYYGFRDDWKNVLS